MRVQREAKIIVVILICAIFNDILRIPGTEISFFRIFIPLAFLILLYSKELVEKYLLGMLAMFACSVIQNLLCMQKYQIDFYMFDMLKYWLLYISIVLLFALVHILHRKYWAIFVWFINQLLPKLGIISLCIYFIKLITNCPIIANINNWACCLNMFFPLFLIKVLNRKWENLIWCILIIAEMWVGDSKAALAGIAIEIVIVFILRVRNRISSGWALMPFFTLIGMIILILIATSRITVNGYVIREMFFSMIEAIRKNYIYERVTNSLIYRINAIVILLNIYLQNMIVGVGPGNSAKILATYMVEEATYKATNALAPHISILEFIVDNGIWATLIILWIIMCIVKNFFAKKVRSDFDIYMLSALFSFFMWNMSASGLYTTYLVFIVFAIFREKKENDFSDEVLF